MRPDFTLNDRGVQNDVREELGFAQLPEVAEISGITADALDAALRGAGLDAATLAAVVNGLPADVGVSRNTVTPEGSLNGKTKLPVVPAA